MVPLVDVYHSGNGHPHPPFLLVHTGNKELPGHPDKGSHWALWKQIPLNVIAVDVAQASASREPQGFYIQ